MIAKCGHRPSGQRQMLLNGLLLLSAITLAQAQLQTSGELNGSFYYVGCFKERTDLLKESIYAKTPQTCVDICEHQTYSYAILDAARCYCSNTIVSADRLDEQLCNTRCLVNKSQYCGGVGVHSYYSTMLQKEPAPKNLKIENVTENSLLIKWEKYDQSMIPIDQHEAEDGSTTEQRITNFLIRSFVVHSYSRLPFFPQPEFIVQSSEHRFEITDLHPATTYNVTVEAMCEQIVCGRASLIGVTAIGVPSPPPKQPQLIESTDTTMTIRIPAIRNDNGPVSKVLVIVERTDDALSQTFDETLLGDLQQAQENGLSYYITAELDYQRPDDANKSRLFVVGDGKRYGRYLNEPVDNKDTHMHIILGVVSTLNGLQKTLFTNSSHDQHFITMENFKYATFETGHQSIIALTVTCVIFATCLLLSVITYLYLRYKTNPAQNTLNSIRNTHEMTLQQPIIDHENNGFVLDDECPVSSESFNQRLNKILETLTPSKRIPRNALRMNVNDVIADGCFGEVISGTLMQTIPTTLDTNSQCQLHVLALDDLSSDNQLKLLKEFSHLTRLASHEHVLDFYGVSASADWFYFIFELQTVSLKRRLIESRRAPNTVPVQRLTALSEELVLQWIYEIASAMQYITDHKIVHRQLCSHSIFVTAEAKIKLSIFGPIPMVNNGKKVNISRWLAPEVLRYQHYSTKSDVWALGCVAWECCTLGGTLYPNITSIQDLLPAIKGSARPAQPSFVYQDLYQLLLNCWQLEPSDRINFEDITFNVRQLMTSPRHALCFDRLPESTCSNILDTLPFYLPMLELSD